MSGEVRREAGRVVPLGPKAAATRERIVGAALALFAEHGYQPTTVADVAVAAGVSIGTVYQYFTDRADLVETVVRNGVARVAEAGGARWQSEDGYEGVYRLVYTFVHAYAEQAALLGVWEEVSQVDAKLRELRRSIGHELTAGVAKELRRAARRGDVREDVDPYLAAVALTGMVDRFCYVTYVLDPPARLPSAEAAAELLSRLWAGALGVEGGADGLGRQRKRPQGPRFLSVPWLAGLERRLAGEEPLVGGAGLVVQYEVTGTPDGDVAYFVQAGGGSVTVRPGVAEAPDVAYRQAYETAVSTARGTLSLEAALLTGRLDVTAESAVLSGRRVALAALEVAHGMAVRQALGAR